MSEFKPLSASEKTRKLESIAKLLIDTKNDHEFVAALMRARAIAHDSQLSLKDIMLANLNITTTVLYENSQKQDFGESPRNSSPFDDINGPLEKFINAHGIFISQNSEDWVSAQILYKKAQPFFIYDGKKISLKAFIQSFCEKTGAKIVFGGRYEKYKGFLIESTGSLY